jgi:hypothetical protein
MTTQELVDFYYAQTRNEDNLPRKLDTYSIVVGDPGSMGSKGGIQVLQLHDPGRYGKVEVRGHLIKTTNVKSLEFDPLLWKDSVVINGRPVEATELGAPVNIPKSGINERSTITQRDTSAPRRRGRQLGSMTAILRTNGPFIIRHSGSANTSHVALQISRNLHQYFQADAEIHTSFSVTGIRNVTGNIITLVVNDTIPDPTPSFPIRVGKAKCSIVDQEGHEQHYGSTARGAAFLRPGGDERLDLVLWGADGEGLGQAARIMPMLTGVGQPDFVVFGESAKWRGIQGVLAMGFLDAEWKVTASSVVDTDG